MRATGLGEVVLNVASLVRATAFYRDLLGLAVLAPGGNGKPAFLKAGEAAAGVPSLVVLVELAAGSPPLAAPRALHHLALTIPAGGEATARSVLEAAGLEVRRGVHPVFGFETLYVYDPDGNEVELIAPAG